ncbi:MAG: YhgE/Pip domain-containing protein [Rubrivivax sp.]
MRLLRDALEVARLEGSLFRRFPKLRLSVIGIVLIPALYVLIYLRSVWDPVSQTGNLPAAIVNLDRGTTVNGQAVDLGAELARGLEEKRAFGFYRAADADAARSDVRRGHSLFALIIPESFSADAMAAGAPGAGKVVVYASEGNNYAGAGFAKRFAESLGHQLNETLNEKRWTAVLGSSASAADSLQRLRDGVQRLQQGARALDGGLVQAVQGSASAAAGSRQLAGGVAALTDGVRQLGAGIRTLDGRKPAAAELQALKDGAAQLEAGHVELQKALPALEDGAQRLAQGAGQLREQSKGIPFAGAKVAAAAGQLADGAAQLQAGLHAAGQGQARLKDGAQALDKGVVQLADGFAAYAGGVSAIAARLPPQGRLDELSAGAGALAGGSAQLSGGMVQLKSGAAQLAAGLQTLAGALPAGSPGLPGTSGGLAHSVQPVVEIDAPVKNNGLGFAPNFLPVALWLGAVMTAFIFHLRRLPEAARGRSRAALLLGKLGVLGSINLAQAACVLLMSWLLLELQPVHAAGLALTMGLSALTFMLVILLLVRAFGDAGKALALILLVLQLSAAGGVMPIELTSAFYRAVSPWLPFTWAIKAVRASAFGALGGDWGAALGMLALFALGAFGLSLVVGRWTFVPPDEHRPAMDI